MSAYEIKRKTKETDIAISLNLYGKGEGKIDTGVGFFDHMLTALGVHGGFDLNVTCKGDLEVDCHHTVEDVGIALGMAFRKATEDKAELSRYGTFTIPMDEALATCSVDISGRPFLVFHGEFRGERMGGMDTQMVGEFFRAFAMNAGITLHANLHYGENDHHKAEALFKALAHSLRLAVAKKAGEGVLSTKGCLE